MQRHEREVVRRRQGLVEDSDDLELVVDEIGARGLRRLGQIDGVSNALAEFFGDVRPQDNLAVGNVARQYAGLGAEFEVLVVPLTRGRPRDLVWNPEAEAAVGLVLGSGRGK